MSVSIEETTAETTSRAEREAMAIAGDPILARMLEEERVEGQDLDLTLLWKLLGYLAPYRLMASVGVAMSVVESLLMTLPAYVIGLALDRVSSRSQRDPQIFDAALDATQRLIFGLFGVSSSAAATIVFFGVVVLVVWGLRWAVAVGTTYLVQRLGQFAIHDLRVDVYRHLTGMDQGYLHKNPVGRLVNRTTFDVQSLSGLFSDELAHMLRDVIFVVVLVAVMLTLDLPLALLLVGAFPLLIAVALLYRRMARPALRTNSAVQSRMNAWLAENISGMRENQLYGRERRRKAEWRALTDAHQASITHVLRSWAVLRPGMMLVSAVATALVLWIGYGRVEAGILSIGVLLTFLQYTTRLWVPVRNLTEKFNVIQTALTAGERIFDVLESPAALVDADDADPQLEVEQGRVAFEEVRFGYPGTDEEVLHGVSFEVAPGQMLALVGDTGAGKSTIAHLVSRFYDATGGRVLVDGHDVRRYTVAGLRRGVAIVPQDVVVFAGTVRDNITLGISVGDDAVMEAVRAVGAEPLLQRFAGGLDHVMEEGGRTLSAGERQLLSFARALVFNPPILVLDEATASVDTRTEMAIQRALEELTRGRTTIVIAHRLSTIRDADQILLLRDGRVVERGGHEALLALGGEYARLYRAHVEG